MKLYLQFAEYIMCVVVQLLLMCLSRAADSTQQVESNGKTLHIDINPEGNQCCIVCLFVTLCVCQSACMSTSVYGGDILFVST